MVPPSSDRIARVPPYSRTRSFHSHTGLSPAAARLSRRFWSSTSCHWPLPLSLATTHGVSVDVLSSGYMRCFSSPGLLLTPMDSAADNPCGLGCPIRKSAGQRVLAPRRSLSQLATSFIACARQGILQTPLLKRLIAQHWCPMPRNESRNGTRSFGSRYSD